MRLSLRGMQTVCVWAGPAEGGAEPGPQHPNQEVGPAAKVESLMRSVWRADGLRWFALIPVVDQTLSVQAPDVLKRPKYIRCLDPQAGTNKTTRAPVNR